MHFNLKMKVILIATTLFIFKSINYYNSDDAIHQNHTIHDEINELSNYNNAVSYTHLTLPTKA